MKTKLPIAFWIGLFIVFGLCLSGVAAWWLLSFSELGLKDWPWTSLSALAAAPALILTWYWRTAHRQKEIDTAEERAQIDEQRLLTERFTRAIELLGSEKLQIRLGGIYALERIAQDSERDHWTVMETLCAFVREKTREPKRRASAAPENGETPTGEEGKKPSPEEMFEPPDTDIQAALTVIGRRGEERRKWEKKEGKRLDLGGAHLEQIDLQYAHLEYANLEKAYLEGANLKKPHLEGAVLLQAHLEGTYLVGTRLEGANLQRTHLKEADLTATHLKGVCLVGAHIEGGKLEFTNLEGAHLVGAHLEGAKFLGTHLKGANFYRADLAGVDFVGANLRSTKNLTQSQIDSAYIDDETILPEGITRPVREE